MRDQTKYVLIGAKVIGQLNSASSVGFFPELGVLTPRP